MDAQIKTKWVEALRSGKYKQGRSALRIDDTYCCLGVLCEVAELGKWSPLLNDDDEPTGMYWMEFNAGDRDADLLLISVRESIGLDAEGHKACWRMNDDERKSFSEIADYIEQNL